MKTFLLTLLLVPEFIQAEPVKTKPVELPREVLEDFLGITSERLSVITLGKN